MWRTDGQKPRSVPLTSWCRKSSNASSWFRFIASPMNTLPGRCRSRYGERQRNPARLEQRRALRAERSVDGRLTQLPSDMVSSPISHGAAGSGVPAAMRRANIKGALVGVEAVTPEGLKDVYKGFNEVGEALVARLRTFREHGVYVLGSFIFGLPSDRPSTFEATADIADRAGVAFAQFVMLTPYPGTLDFAAWEKSPPTTDTLSPGCP